MKKEELTTKDLDCLVAYRIDTCNKYSLLKTLRLLNDLDCSFSDIGKGKKLYQEINGQ